MVIKRSWQYQFLIFRIKYNLPVATLSPLASFNTKKALSYPLKAFVFLFIIVNKKRPPKKVAAGLVLIEIRY
ncbi:hypothetical protein C0W28_00450 [Photobacterium kishitanii]|nr:hypothetical protein C0W28_00450 [Photobacterium kishitanii]